MLIGGENKENLGGSRAEGVVSKKDTKIRQLIESNNKLKQDLKKANESNSKLEHEATELRRVIQHFEHKEGSMRLAGNLELELERYKKQVAVLTRALAVSAVEGGQEGDALISQGEAAWRESETLSELERLKIFENELEVTNQELAVMKLKLADKQRIEQELTCARVEVDKLVHEIVSLEDRLRLVSDERDKAESEKLDNEKIMTALKAEMKQGLVHADERFREYAKKGERLELDFVALEAACNKHRLRVQELELLLQERDQREQETRSEINVMKSALADFDGEIRRLAVSLSAEAEANDNLTSRLSRADQELDTANISLAQERRKLQELESDMQENRKAKFEFEKCKKDIFKLENILRDKDSRIQELCASRDAAKRTLSGEIERLGAEVHALKVETVALKDKCMHAHKERDRFKALLASETLARMRIN